MANKDVENIKKAFEPLLIIILKLPFWVERYLKWYKVDSKYDKYRNRRGKMSKEQQNKLIIPAKVASIFEGLEFDWRDLMFGDYDLDDLSQKEIRLLVKYFGGDEEDFRIYFTEKFMKYFLIYKASKELGLDLVEYEG